MLKPLGLVLLMASAALAQGKLAPVDEAGYPKMLSASRGKVLLVDFWATYCKPCRAETPALVAIEEKLKAKGVKLIMVSADEPEQEAAAAKFLAGARVNGPWFIRRAKDDDRFINLVDPKWNGALPALFLYDRSGRKVKAWFGETAAKDVESAVVKLL